MGQPYVGEIRIFAGNFAPQGWAFCNGALLPIDQYAALFTLIGTTYGGDGQTTFALPDLQGRVPINMGQLAGGQNYVIGQKAGTESVTLTSGQIAAHTHAALCDTGGGNSPSPAGAIWAASTSAVYAGTPQNPANPTGTMSGTPFTGGGGNQPHPNIQPFVVLTFIFSLFGIFPTQN